MIPAIRRRTGADVDALFSGPFPLIQTLHCEFFRQMSDRHKPSKLIKNQNASTINADKLNAKLSETIISSAPAAFNSE